jgi:hypothetical protein
MHIDKGLLRNLFTVMHCCAFPVQQALLCLAWATQGGFCTQTRDCSNFFFIVQAMSSAFSVQQALFCFAWAVQGGVCLRGRKAATTETGRWKARQLRHTSALVWFRCLVAADFSHGFVPTGV